MGLSSNSLFLIAKEKVLLMPATKIPFLSTIPSSFLFRVAQTRFLLEAFRS